MKRLLVIWLLCMVPAAFGKPALVVIDRTELKGEESGLTILRDNGQWVFAAAEAAALRGIRYQMLDADYDPERYLMVRGAARAAELQLPILWHDEAGALVKLSRTPQLELEHLADAERLEQRRAPIRPSRPPSGLDDPALDQWLADLGTTVNADTLMAFVTRLASWNRYTRWLSNDTAATWILNKFQSYGLDSAYFHLFTASGTGWTRTARNVIGVQVGSVYPDSIVIIGGHMDATSQSPSTGAPGAEDNASGTAAVIEAARLLSPYTFTHTLMYVAFNGEEQGLQGSAALANQMAAAGRNVIAVINMDMIGYRDPAGADLWIEGFYTGTNSAWLIYAVRDNCLQFTDLVPYIYTSNGWGSDHQSFWNAGYPAILSIENEYGSYACYHNTCDLPSQITASFLRKMAVVNILTAAELAAPLGTGGISGAVTLQGAQNHAEVQVRVVGGTASAQTAASGVYQMQNLLAGNYSLAFARTGWTADTLFNIAVVNGQVTPNQNITLSAAMPGSISGLVTVAGGGSVTDAIVSAGGAVADVADNGTFTLTPVYAGQHVVTAALDNHSLASTVVALADGQHLTGVNLALLLQINFESSGAGFNNNASGWTWGTDAVAGYHSATRVWGTALGANYINCGNYRLDTPPYSLANLDSARLTFWHWYDIEPSGATVDYDGANVKIAPFGTDAWQVIHPVGGYPQGAGYTCNPIQNEDAWNGTSGAWLPVTFDLAPYIGQTVKLRFHLGTDQGVTRRGWYLDDFALLAWHSYAGTAPDAVADLTVYPLAGDLRLRWSAAAGATGYRIYRSENGDLPIEDWTLLATQAGTAYTDTGAAGLPRAFYVVVAVN